MPVDSISGDVRNGIAAASGIGRKCRIIADEPFVVGDRREEPELP